MYRQPRASFEARVYTADYRIYCNIHLLMSGGTADFLNADSRSHIPLTGVLIYSAGFEHPPRAADLKADIQFSAVHKSDILWLVGGRPSAFKGNLAQVEKRRVALFYDRYILAGDFDVRKDARLSDYLSVAKTFDTLHNVSLYAIPQGQPIANLTPDQEFDFVTVNLTRAESIGEAPQPGPGGSLSLLR